MSLRTGDETLRLMFDILLEVNPGFGLIKEVVPLSYVGIESEALLFQPLSSLGC